MMSLNIAYVDHAQYAVQYSIILVILHTFLAWLLRDLKLVVAKLPAKKRKELVSCGVDRFPSAKISQNVDTV